MQRFANLSNASIDVIITQTEIKDTKEKGSRVGVVVRALASQQCDSGSSPARCHMWVESVVGSRLAPRVFLRILRVFLSPEKATFPTSNSIRIEHLHENQLGLM